MKRNVLSILALLCLTVSSAWADDEDGTTEHPWTSGGCSVTLVNGTLTVSKSASGDGAMAGYDSRAHVLIHGTTAEPIL